MTPAPPRFPFTTAATVLSCIVLGVAVFGRVNLIELPIGLLGRIEQNEVDDIITMFVVLAAAFLVDRTSARRAARQAATLDAERLRVVHVTIRTVQDIVNNCLNGLQLLPFLRELGDLEAYAERQMVVAVVTETFGFFGVERRRWFFSRAHLNRCSIIDLFRRESTPPFRGRAGFPLLGGAASNPTAWACLHRHAAG